MASITFTKTSLREAIIARHDNLIEQATEALTRATDPESVRQQREVWREECIDRLNRMAALVAAREVSDEDLTDFELPRRPKPSSRDDYAVRSMRAEITDLTTRKTRALARVEAMSGESIALTPKQLSDYFNV